MGKISFYKKIMLCFVLHYVCFLDFFMVLWASFSIYALLFSSHCVYVLDMHTFFMPCTLLIACSDDHLLCYLIIVVISIWLFCVWSSCSFVSHHVYLIKFYLYFTLILYYLLYLEGLMCLVQVFYDTGILFQVHHRF